jgi:hypothetical protein
MTQDPDREVLMVPLFARRPRPHDVEAALQRLGQGPLPIIATTVGTRAIPLFKRRVQVLFREMEVSPHAAAEAPPETSVSDRDEPSPS